ncbi:MAG: ATP-binding protein [Pseudomonadota bacterium]
MRLRFGMSVRIGLIVMIALFAGWLTLIAGFYISADGGRKAALPTPERLAAMTEIVERTDPLEREDLLTALSGRNLSVWIGPGEPDVASTPRFDPIETALFEPIMAALAPRQVAILPQPITRIGGPIASPINAIELQIGLPDGEILFVESSSPIVVAAVGIPVGFVPAIIATLIALGTLIILHREFGPLSRLAVAVDKVDPMQEPVALPAIRARSPELRALVAAFERLQDRLSVLIRGRMALIGGIQHDLRTFATRLRLRADKITDPEERARAVQDISDMIQLLDDALLASRAGANELDEELVELAELIASEVMDRSVQSQAVSLTIAPKAQGLTVLGDRLALRRIIGNLIDNALKFGKQAQLSLTVEHSSLVLTVDDKGPGIPVEMRPVLLEPFTRLEGSRARGTGGSGLGLSVVGSLLSAHRGTLCIDDAPGGGARVEAKLPIFKPSLAD